VAVEQLVDRGAGLGVAVLVDLVQRVRTFSASAAAPGPAGTTSSR